MNNLKSIVPPLELCKQIPEGEFEDSALVWVYDDVVGFLCRTSGCEQIHKKEWQLEHNHPRKIAIRRKSGHEIYPAPTLAEIVKKLPVGNMIFMDSPEVFGAISEAAASNAKVSKENTPEKAALRLWFKVKGIEVK